MCGIAGVLNLNGPGDVSEDLLRRMIGAFRYRGPDQSGTYLDDQAGLAHARLSIIGLDDGCQPIGNEAGSLWIVFNGEAYNYLELRQELENRGRRFSTTTDTEVLLQLFEEFGPHCLEMINGQFAIAIWDNVKHELFLARDRIGVRPLFYTLVGGRLLFASEVKALFQDPAVPREIDPRSLCQVFTCWSTVSPRNVFRGVQELPPGHFLSVKAGKISTERFWEIPFYPRGGEWQGSMAEAEEELRLLMKDAVRLRLRADVPVGAYLSGGLDSSVLTTLISSHFNNRLRTFSLGFEESGLDETSFQDELVQSLGTDHSHIMVSNEAIRDLFPTVIWHCETPLLRTAPVPLCLLSGLVQEHGFKVVLTGEGGDEVFGGYNIFKEAKVRAFWGRVPESKLRPLLVQRLYPYVFENPARGRLFLQQFFAVQPGDLQDPLFSHRIRWENGRKNTAFFSQQTQAELAGYHPIDEVTARLPGDFPDRDVLAKAQFLETAIFLPSYLLSSQGDRVAMTHSVEQRHPFLDYRVVDFAAQLPPHWKLSGLNEKYLLKRAFKGLIPERIRIRPKQPYRAPIRDVFFREGGDGYAEEFLSEGSLRRTGYFDPGRVGHLVAKQKRTDGTIPNESQNMALAGILSTQILHQQFVEAFSRSEPLVPDLVVDKRARRER
jgi:asparagine synthase (glutamine-hydrolysing)